MMRTLLIVMTCLLPALAYGQPSASSPVAFSGAASSCSGTVTVSGSNPLLVAAIHLVNGSGTLPVADANYNGDALTFIAGIPEPNASNNRTELWYLHAPDAGSNTFTANFAQAEVFLCRVYVLTGAHQSAALGNSVTAADATDTPTANLSSATTELVITANTNNGDSFTCAPGAGQTEHYDEDFGAIACGSSEVGAGTTTASHTLSAGARFWSLVAAGFKEVSVASPSRKRIGVMIQ
jgi:hypothetical protein